MELKGKLSDYTEYQFIQLLEEIFKENEAETDDQLSVLLTHFANITEHPAGTDLIYYPEEGADDSAAGITETVKKWREANGLPGFKPRFQPIGASQAQRLLTWNYYLNYTIYKELLMAVPFMTLTMSASTRKISH